MKANGASVPFLAGLHPRCNAAQSFGMELSVCLHVRLSATLPAPPAIGGDICRSSVPTLAKVKAHALENMLEMQ